MNTTHHGRLAEEKVSDYLTRQGYNIIDHNWRTRWCEIDLVARHVNTVYFVEVKYRKSAAQGSGLDYITKAKIRQITFAAEFWLSLNNWRGETQLLAAEVSGPNFEHIQLLEITG